MAGGDDGTKMKTRYYSIGNVKEGEELLQEAAKYIRCGETVAIPTETVYGLAADGLNEKACARIFEAKERPADNPLILHIADIASVDELVIDVTPQHRTLMEALWPGPLTLIFKCSDLVPKAVTAGGDTVAIRFPSHPIARRFIEICGTPLAAPSANQSGRPSPTNASDVLADMDGRICAILDGGPCEIGLESTVLDMTVSPAKILRPGYYTMEDLSRYLKVELDENLLDTKALPRSPGQKYRHYAPKAEYTVYTGSKENVVAALKAAREEYKKKGKKVGLLVFNEDASNFPEEEVLTLGSYDDEKTMGRLLFAKLREFDRRGVDVILGVGVESVGYGTALMNRIVKATEGRIVEV